MFWNIFLVLSLVVFVISIWGMIITNSNALKNSWQRKMYVYIYEHDDYLIWNYVNSRVDDVEYTKDAYDYEIGTAYYFKLPIPDYKSLKFRGENWKKAVESWDNGNEPVLELVLWDEKYNEPKTSIHWNGGCLASDFYYEGSHEMTEELLNKLYTEDVDYQS